MRLFTFLFFLSLIHFALSSLFAAQEFIIKLKSHTSFNKKQVQGIITILKNNYSFQSTKLDTLFPLFMKSPLSDTAFSQFYLLRLKNLNDSTQFLKSLQNLPGIAYVEPNYTFHVFQQPGDEFFPKQWYLQQIGAIDAWQVEKGSPEVIVGVLDTGIDYQHEDLQGQLWVNPAEDLNGNGQLDLGDMNGVDDDGNGYVDDVIGWDFTDAPRFPDFGDYLDPDNDPRDEFPGGHGTPIAGIIAARQNNRVGISGIAPSIRIMALRAGTASGFLEEDDVAEAILYAIHNGCKIINMSFGDVAYSQLLKDVIRYGQSRGVIFVAAIGNDGDTRPMYPAAYDETIAVGATTASKNRASFSSYGDHLDLVAPGQEIFTCTVNNGYGYVNGTSFAAPMVSAALGLLWSHYPEATASEVIAMLKSHCLDLGMIGWDPQFGNGLLQINRSLISLQSGLVDIEKPENERGISKDSLILIGSVTGAPIERFEIRYGLGENPAQWETVLTKESVHIVHDTLGILNISHLPDTLITVELRAHQHLNSDLVTRRNYEIDHTAPQLDSIIIYPLLKGPFKNFLMQLYSDDASFLKILFLDPLTNRLLMEKNYPFLRKRHFALLSQSELEADFRYSIILKNNSGLEKIYPSIGSQILHLSKREPLKNIFMFKKTYPIQGYLFGDVTDFNRDQIPELLISEATTGTPYGAFSIYQILDNQLQLQYQTSFPAIPRDVGDISANGTLEVLIGYGGASWILSQDSPATFRFHVLWADSNNFWGSRLVNVDEDSALELLAIKDGEWGIYDISEENPQPQLKQKLPNVSDGSNQYGVPHIVVGDITGDGIADLIYGDYDGDVLLFSHSDLNEKFELTAMQRLPGKDATELIELANLDGQPPYELVTISRVVLAEATESEIDARFWKIEAWQWKSGELKLMAERNIQGIPLLRGVYTGLTVRNVDGDAKDELYFSTYPDLYVLQLENGQFLLNTYLSGINTSQVLFVNQVGIPEMSAFMNTLSGITEYQLPIDMEEIQPPPMVNAVALDTNLVQLSWWGVSRADYYKLYRRSSGEVNFTFLDSTTQLVYLDSTVKMDNQYFYYLTSVEGASESRPGRAVSVVPNEPPKVQSVQRLNPTKILIKFSKPMGESAFNINNYRIRTHKIFPVSIIKALGRRAALLNFPDDLSSTEFSLQVWNVSDSAGTPLSRDTLLLQIPAAHPGSSFYLKRVVLVNSATIYCMFNRPVDSFSATNSQNYLFKPHLKILSAKVDQNNPAKVILKVDKKNWLGSLGKVYYLTVKNLKDYQGNPLSEAELNKFMIGGAAEDLQNIIVYPNPLIVTQSKSDLTFGNLPDRCEIFILTAQGKLVRKLYENDGDGGISWDLRNEAGKEVGSGVYLYYVKTDLETRMGKFLIIK